jgi:hypothetical protein
MVASGLLLLLAAVRPWDGLDVMVGDDVVLSRSVTAWQISPLCWVPLVVGMALVPLWFAPRTAALWRWLPSAVSGLAMLGVVAVLLGLGTGPSDDYGWYAGVPLTGNPDVRYIDGRASPILLALAGLAIQAYAGLARKRARRRASRPLVGPARTDQLPS